MRPKPFIRDRIYIPAKDVELDAVHQHYQQKIYDDGSCQKCWNLENRHDEQCENCEAFLGQVKLWQEVIYKDHRYIALPSGYPKRVAKKLGLDLKTLRFRDKRPVVKWDSDLEWQGKLYKGQVVDGEKKADQVSLISGWLKKYEEMGGLIETPPRTGKTVIGVYGACKLGVKTYITASQMEFLIEFCMRFSELTNLRELSPRGHNSPILLVDPNGWDGMNTRDRKGHCGVEIVKSWDRAKRPIEAYDVIISTYQQFIHKETGEKKSKKYLKNRSLLIVDEVDQANAQAFSRFINRSIFRYKMGLTATVDRKDGLQFVVRDVIGPVVSRGVTTAMVPQIELMETGIGKGKEYGQWWRIERYLSTSKQRNKKIVQQVFKDLRSNPKASILIPVRHIKHIKLLTKMINDQAALNNRKRGENWPDTCAIEYKQGVNKTEALNMIGKGQCKVVVAIAKMMSRGLDVPAWTHVYVGVIPTSNPPFFYQLANRVCTPYIGKAQPIIRMLVDAMPVSIHCFKALVFKEIATHLKPDDKKRPPRYKMTQAVYERAMEIAKYPREYAYEDSKPKEEKKDSRKAF